MSQLHIKEGVTAEARQQEARLANHSVSICRTLFIQRSVILLREQRLALFTTRTLSRIIPSTITAGNRAVGLKSQVVLPQTAMAWVGPNVQDDWPKLFQAFSVKFNLIFSLRNLFPRL